MYPGTTTQSFNYDGVDRLTEAVGAGSLHDGKTSQFTQTYAYSASHNLLHKTQVNHLVHPDGNFDAPPDTNYDAPYVYDASRPHVPTAVGGLAIAYDPSGNPTSRIDGGNRLSMVWDDDNRMVQASRPRRQPAQSVRRERPARTA